MSPLESFDTALKQGLAEDNLRELIKLLTLQLRVPGCENPSAIYTVQAVLDDLLRSRIEGVPVETAVLERFERALIPSVHAVLAATRGPADALLRSMNDLVQTYLKLDR